MKDYSGRTVADWVNIAIIHEAKVLLRYSDLSSYEIADRLNFSAASAFSAFFKRCIIAVQFGAGAGQAKISRLGVPVVRQKKIMSPCASFVSPPAGVKRTPPLA